MLRTRHTVVAAGFAPSHYDDVAFVDLSTLPRSAAGRPLRIARRLAGRHESVFWGYPENREALRRLEAVAADVVVVNDPRGLPIAFALDRPVVFDAHEYAPDELLNDFWWRVLERPQVRWLCRRYLPQVAGMTAVGPEIAAAYERDVGIHAEIVLNAPPFADLAPTPVHSPIRLLHHGGAQRDRGLEELVDLVDRLDERFTLDLVLIEATPGLRDELIRRAAGNPRVHFPSPVPMRELPRLANGYDIGVYSLPPLNFNQRFALPNKLFEFIQGRLAVAIGPSPEMAAIVRKYECGVVAPDFGPASLAAALNGLDAAAIAAFKDGSDRAARDLTSERSAEVMLNVVDAAIVRRGRDGGPVSRWRLRRSR